MRSPESELDELRSQNLYRERRFLSGANGKLVEFGGAKLLNFSSNDYLGLAGHPAVIRAAREAADSYGGGTSASRLVFGGGPAHQELERLVADLLGKDSALCFANGYGAAVGAIPAIVGKGDTILLDKRCHASLIDGARLSGATIRVFPHNGLEKLERLLQSLERDSGPDTRTLIVTESVFSMDGDTCPLAEIVRLKVQYGALVALDEAHALGVIGPGGRGLAAREESDKDIDFLMATFGKSAGAAGGCVAASESWIDLIANRARSFIYSTAPPSSQAAAAAAGLKIIASREGDELRGKLEQNIGKLAEALSLPPPPAAIFPIVLGEETAALNASMRLQELGFLVPAIRYPTVARGAARLRITASAANNNEEINSLADALSSLR